MSQLSALAPLASVPAADGAFYCLLKVNTTLDPMTIAERLIREHKVAVIPGPAFGMTDGCYFRVAYGALQKETVAEGIGRLVNGLRARAREEEQANGVGHGRNPRICFNRRSATSELGFWTDQGP